MTDDPRLPRVVLRGIGAVLLATQGFVHLWLWLFGFETQWTWSGPEGAALWSELLAAIALIALVLWRRNAVPGAAVGFANAR